MITFKQFISEQNSTFDIEQFIKDCSFALSLLDKNHLLYRGIANPHSQVAIEQWRPRSTPLNTNKLVHQSMNDAFEEMFGARIRDWLFCTGDITVAREYTTSGNDEELFAIFPIGKFEWVGCLDEEFKDMTRTTSNCLFQAERELNADYNSSSTPEVKSKLLNRAIEIMKSFLNKSDWRQNIGLKNLLSADNEIMIKCDRYYCISLASAEFKQIFEVLK